MQSYTQANRPISITTPLGEDALLLTALTGREGVSELFNFRADLLADAGNKIRFDEILGASVTVEMDLANDGVRYFSGIVKRFSQGPSDDKFFVHYRAEIVPKLWLLTKRVRCRTFQHCSVPDILRKVLEGLEASYELSAAYPERDYCVQYRESDFDFVRRLMEEEGIYYFFKHRKDGHEVVVTDEPIKHPLVPGDNQIIYDLASGGNREDQRIKSWEKSQELRAGEYTTWDHHFELPGNPLEAKEKTVESVRVGVVNHKLRAGGNEELEIYDYPGGYAHRFDGVDGHGVSTPQRLQGVFAESERTVRIRMEQEESLSLAVEGTSDCGQFTAGHAFALERHFDGNGQYLLTRVDHEARLGGNYRSGEGLTFNYENSFTCIPSALPFRPQRVTPKPVISGIQTATVVGPAGEEIFCDKYGRVKVQFHWDREAKKDGTDSCWLRVAQVWAGKRWGAFFWPRIGHEVVVAFEDGDPDRPLIVGSVYNAENMPPLALPATDMFCGIKSASVRGLASQNFNSLVFVDKKGMEHLALQSERHMILNAELDVATHNGRHHFHRVPGAHMLSVGSLPGTGGSGGGPWPVRVDAGRGTTGGGSGGSGATTTPMHVTVSGTPWAQPQPTSVLGLQSSVVYGAAFQASLPMSLQLATNSLMKIVVDPVGFGEAFPEQRGVMSTASLGLGGFVAGANGNVQLTLGNYANIIVGRSYDIQVGPRAVRAHAHDKSADSITSPLHAAILGALAIVFQLAYALLGSVSSSQVNDDARGLLVCAFQAAALAVVASLMSSGVAWEIADDEVKIALAKIHAVNGKLEGLTYVQDLEDSIEDLKKLQGGVLAGSLLSALVVPPLVDSISEIELGNTSGLP